MFHFVFSSQVIYSFSQILNLDGDLQSMKNEHMAEKINRCHIPTAPLLNRFLKVIIYLPINHTPIHLFQPIGKFHMKFQLNRCNDLLAFSQSGPLPGGLLHSR